ncbi:hypothetical protein M2416_002582 [Raoultella sp. BIGb0132]|nr:hypothetical protein [Raoultella sp. BIGb0132]MCS4289067.1 hypothetical protein [Raoultella terrigena]
MRKDTKLELKLLAANSKNLEKANVTAGIV